MTPPRIQSLVECEACHRTDIPLLDEHPFMTSHTWRPDQAGQCSAGGSSNWLERSLRHVRHPDHDQSCEATFAYGSMTWSGCHCAERQASAAYKQGHFVGYAAGYRQGRHDTETGVTNGPKSPPDTSWITLTEEPR